MAQTRQFQNQISSPLNSNPTRVWTDQRLCTPTSRFEDSPIEYIKSPLDKPLPPLPTPVENQTPNDQFSKPANLEPSRARAPIFVDANDIWRQRYKKASSGDNWIDMLFANREVSFGAKENGYAWKLGHRIFENTRLDRTQPYATALYECVQVKGRVHGPQALMKIYMQLPHYCYSCDHISVKPCRIPQSITNEVDALKRMSRVEGDIAAPRLLAAKSKLQSRKMWVPGGFATFVVMQHLPGMRLEAQEFWKFDVATRDEIRRSFRLSLQNLWRAGVMPRNCGIERLSWDRFTRKCYIVDLEGADIITHSLHWWDFEFYRWGLSRTTSGSWEPPVFDRVQTPADFIDKKIRHALEGAASRDNNVSKVQFVTTGPDG